MRKYRVTEITSIVSIYEVEARDELHAEDLARQSIGHLPDYDDITDRVYEVEDMGIRV